MDGRKRENRDILAGLATVLLGAFFVVYAITTPGLSDEGGYQLVGEFRQVDGLRVGDPVLLAGVPVGSVSAMQISETLRPEVELTIRTGVDIPVDSAALVVSDGLLGGKFIKIEPGAEDRVLADGDRFDFVQNAVVIERILKRIVEQAERRRSKQKEEGSSP